MLSVASVVDGVEAGAPDPPPAVVDADDDIILVDGVLSLLLWIPIEDGILMLRKDDFLLLVVIMGRRC